MTTWNDYEEGTEIETGIENCVEIQTSISDRSLSWTVKGNGSAVEHFTIYALPDGQKLIELAQVPGNKHKLELNEQALLLAAIKCSCRRSESRVLRTKSPPEWSGHQVRNERRTRRTPPATTPELR